MGGLLTLPVTFLAGIIAPLFPDILHWLKWMISYVYVYIYLRRSPKRFDLYDFEALNDPEKIGFVVPKTERRLETPLSESLLHRSADDVFCYGINGQKECLLVRVSRRSNQESQATVYLKMANGKTYCLPQDAPQYQQPSGDLSHAFTCGGLKIYYLVPMRRWRIFFSGFLRECSDENSGTEKTIYVKFSFLWRACSDVFDSLSGMSVSELAGALSAAKWNSSIPPLKRLHEMLDFYCQAGMLYGTIKTEEMPEEYEMWLWGERVRILGDVAGMEGAEFLHVLGYTTAGKTMHVGQISIPNTVKNLHFGFLVHYNTIFHTVEKADIRVRNTDPEEEEHYSNLEIKFIADQEHKMSVSFHSPVSSLENENGWYKSLDVNYVNIECGGHKDGNGLVISGSVRKVTAKPTTSGAAPCIPKVPPLVLEFADPLCQMLDLSGGKGSSLAKLMELSQEKGKSLFTVPKGVVVTTAAYQEFTETHFQESVKNLEDVAYGKKKDNLQAVCERLSNTTSERILSERLCRSIEDCLNKVFPGSINTLRFAVRSSATGEDTEQLSAAGQMDTFLGVKGLKEILAAVKKCWASQFKFIAIEYKRRNGQPLNTPMAVVIQEMVPCDVAGVLFTCDPVSGNPSHITITANYGLGESVVSGSVEPDTVTLRRNHRNELHLESYEAGEKLKRIVMSGSEGTEEEFVDESMRQSHCLSDETALELAKIALLVEQTYHSHRDIEWGLRNNEIYLFQARPVTSVSGETDFEIIHEFDGPMRCEKEYFTVVNVGEVMPGASSPLGLDVILKFLGHAFQQQAQKKLNPQQIPASKYFPLGMLPFCNHCMFSLFMLFFQAKEEELSKMTQSTMVGMFGRILDDPELFAVAKELMADTKKVKISTIFIVRFMLNMLLSGYNLWSTKKKFQEYSVPIERFHNSQQLFDELMYRCTDNMDITSSHMSATYGSSMWNMMLLSTLASCKGGFETEVYNDFANLLATCTGVESADVPSAMQSLASCISKEIDKEEFKAMDTEEALEWLQKSSGVANTKFKAFLARHGHRCLKEFDVRSVTWGMDPKLLVKLLQGLVGNVAQDTAEKKHLKTSEAISSLSTSLDLKSRWILRFLLPQCRRGVRERESSKSMLIKGVDGWRRAYTRLAEMMVHEGRIPDKDLLYFFTLDEIQELINTPSSRLIAKANHRRRLFPEMDEYIFPEIMKGVPKPIGVNDSQTVIEGDLTMKGLPVSRGVVKGPARVAMTLTEAALLKPGEILITYSTDIGWSPYFPILGGVVTELGGLISHGAVVAREYGLPCVVGLHGATRQFQTGDYVLLDGNRGILQRLLDDK